MPWIRGKGASVLELLAVLVFGLLLKIFAGGTRSPNGVVLPGYDEYYHMQILYGVNNFPDVLWFDSYLTIPTASSLTWPPLRPDLRCPVSGSGPQHTAGVR